MFVFFSMDAHFVFCFPSVCNAVLFEAAPGDKTEVCASKTGCSPNSFHTDRSKAVLPLQFFFVCATVV